MTFTVFLDFMQEVYNRKLVFDYQDRSGRVHKVETLEAFEAFCAAADNGAPPGHKPEVTVFLRDWKYTEPRFVGPPAPPQYVPRSYASSQRRRGCPSAGGLIPSRHTASSQIPRRSALTS
jgi:hypothetical protein